MQAETAAPPEQFIRATTVTALTGMPYSSIYNEIQRGTFPRPYKISGADNGRRVGWKLSEIIAWQKTRQRTEPPKPAPGAQPIKQISDGNFRLWNFLNDGGAK